MGINVWLNYIKPRSTYRDRYNAEGMYKQCNNVHDQKPRGTFWPLVRVAVYRSVELGVVRDLLLEAYGCVCRGKTPCTCALANDAARACNECNRAQKEHDEHVRGEEPDDDGAVLV